MTKYIAIQLFGHLRTYRQTYQKFYENLVNPCKNAGYEVHIFCHTWDEIDSVDYMDSYPKDMKLAGKKLTEEEIENVLNVYKPKEYLIETQIQEGETPEVVTRRNQAHTFCAANRLRQEYAKKNNINYDLIICTRFDIEFLEPFNNIYEFRDKTGRWEWYDKIGGKDNFYFTSYINRLDSVSCADYLISGIDLFLCGSATSLDILNKWEDDFYEHPTYLPERFITNILYKNQKRHSYITYEKDRCWRIKRFHEKTTWKNKWANSFYKKTLAILKHSPLFLRHISFCSTAYKGTLEQNLSWFLNRKIK